MSQDLELSPAAQAAIDDDIRAELWQVHCQQTESDAVSLPAEELCDKIMGNLIPVIEGWSYMASTGKNDFHEMLETHLRRAWHQAYDAARFTAERASRSLLIVQLLEIRGMGKWAHLDLQCPPLPNGTPLSTVMTSDGELMVDMPLFARHMALTWTRDRHIMSHAQIRNLHAFLATLAATGLDDRLFGIGLEILRDALEAPPSSPWSFPAESEKGVLARGPRPLMPPTQGISECVYHVADIWWARGMDRMKRLAEAEFCDLFPGIDGALGPLAREGGVPETGGFSEERYKFWIKCKGGGWKQQARAQVDGEKQLDFGQS